MKKKVTLKQLAKELNLSISTVSKSLKNDSEISQKTIDRVHELAKFYNYKPNALAVSLKSKKTKTIGILLPDILNHFFAKVLYGIEQEATNNGYKIVTCITNESYKKEVEYIEMLAYSSMDGFIMALSEETQNLQKFDHIESVLEDDAPVVMFDRVTDKIDCDKVIIDDKEASQTAFNYIAEIGCTKIAVISTIADLSVGELRLQGVREKANSTSKVELIELLIKNSVDPEEREQIIEKFLKKNKVDGVIGLDETAAVVTLNMFKKIGRNIPEDISVIGFTDGILSRYSYPKLTIMSQHAESIGVKAAKMLIDKLDSRVEKGVSRTEVIKCTLIPRDSTK